MKTLDSNYSIRSVHPQTLALVAQAIGRGKSKTFGLRSRVLLLGGSVARSLVPRQKELHELAAEQVEIIQKFVNAIRGALALAAAAGDQEKLKKKWKKYYDRTGDARDGFDRAVDAIFFKYLWVRFAARDEGLAAVRAEERAFVDVLHRLARNSFETSLPRFRCASALRPRAEARARRAFNSAVRRHFPEVFERQEKEDTGHAA